MARSVEWRRKCSDLVNWHQTEALSPNTTIYLLRRTGPTGFLLKEEGLAKNIKVFIGDPHRCSCPSYAKEKDLCKHICWILLKKFRISRDDPVSWQLGLVEREVNDLCHVTQLKSSTVIPDRPQDGFENSGGATSSVTQREIGPEDVCPICLENLLEKHEPVTYCRLGCGNSIHIKCMKVYGEHQKNDNNGKVECPMCRADFGEFSLLLAEYRNTTTVTGVKIDKHDEHDGKTCSGCHCSPIIRNCYRCKTCPSFYLCIACFNSPIHEQHRFEYRQKNFSKWKVVQSRAPAACPLPDAVANNLMQRDISETDYDLLLQLDSSLQHVTLCLNASKPVAQPSDLTETSIRSLPLERVRPLSKLLMPGQQCCVCLRGYVEGQFLRRLPCKHRFHRDCIDNWLLHRQPTCPVDGTVYTNDDIRQINKEEQLRKKQLIYPDKSTNNDPKSENSFKPSNVVCKAKQTDKPCSISKMHEIDLVVGVQGFICSGNDASTGMPHPPLHKPPAVDRRFSHKSLRRKSLKTHLATAPAETGTLASVTTELALGIRNINMETCPSNQIYSRFNEVPPSVCTRLKKDNHHGTNSVKRQISAKTLGDGCDRVTSGLSYARGDSNESTAGLPLLRNERRRSSGECSAGGEDSFKGSSRFSSALLVPPINDPSSSILEGTSAIGSDGYLAALPGPTPASDQLDSYQSVRVAATGLPGQLAPKCNKIRARGKDANNNTTGNRVLANANRNQNNARRTSLEADLDRERNHTATNIDVNLRPGVVEIVSRCSGSEEPEKILLKTGIQGLEAKRKLYKTPAKRVVPLAHKGFNRGDQNPESFLDCQTMPLNEMVVGRHPIARKNSEPLAASNGSRSRAADLTADDESPSECLPAQAFRATHSPPSASYTSPSPTDTPYISRAATPDAPSPSDIPQITAHRASSSDLNGAVINSSFTYADSDSIDGEYDSV